MIWSKYIIVFLVGLNVLSLKFSYYFSCLHLCKILNSVTVNDIWYMLLTNYRWTWNMNVWLSFTRLSSELYNTVEQKGIHVYIRHLQQHIDTNSSYSLFHSITEDDWCNMIGKQPLTMTPVDHVAILELSYSSIQVISFTLWLVIEFMSYQHPMWFIESINNRYELSVAYTHSICNNTLTHRDTDITMSTREWI